MIFLLHLCYKCIYAIIYVNLDLGQNVPGTKLPMGKNVPGTKLPKIKIGVNYDRIIITCR